MPRVYARAQFGYLEPYYSSFLFFFLFNEASNVSHETGFNLERSVVDGASNWSLLLGNRAGGFTS